jgi:myo-inositol-1(or 4)-monophosphatase
MELTRLADSAEQVARDAGNILLRYFERIEQIEYKGVGDIVTEADKASERFVRESLQRATPSIPVYGEEYGFDDDSTVDPFDACWIVDPLDGTANYAARVPLFSVSIGLLVEGRPVVGVIYDPTRDEVFRAARGSGAYRNGRAIHVTDRDPLDPVAPIAVSGDVMRQRLGFLGRTYKGRSLGSAAMHLAYVASGLFDAATDPYTKLWDVVAGAVIIEEAGGVVTRWNGVPRFPVDTNDGAYRGQSFDYLVSNGINHQTLVALLCDDPPQPERV